MKHNIILGLALVLSVGFFGHSAVAQNFVKSNHWRGFPIFPPITNANPLIRLPLLVQVPTKLKLGRTTDMLSVEVDNESGLETTNITVGTNMVTGVQSELYVHPVGEPRPAPMDNRHYGGLALASGLDFNLGTLFLHTKPDGLPLPGVKYEVEVDLTVFETDIPAGHRWMPQGKNYKVLWRRTLKQVVE